MDQKEDKSSLMRQAIAHAMEKSHREIPHYYLETEINLQPALTFLGDYNRDRPPAERLLPVTLFVKATALAAQAIPEMNGHYLNGSFQPSDSVHVGLVIALRKGGLMAPALHDIQSKNLSDIMRDMIDLVSRVRSGRVRSSELTDPTITVTSLGENGSDRIFGIIYPPQVALVGFGRIRESGVVSCSLAADHRVSDGLRGSTFLNHMKRFLENPKQLTESS